MTITNIKAMHLFKMCHSFLLLHLKIKKNSIKLIKNLTKLNLFNSYVGFLKKPCSLDKFH